VEVFLFVLLKLAKALRYHSQALVSEFKSFPIFFEIDANDGLLGNDDLFFNYAVFDVTVLTDVHTIKHDGALNDGFILNDDIIEEDRILHAAAGDNATCTDDGVDKDPFVAIVAWRRTGRGVLADITTNQPVRLIEV